MRGETETYKALKELYDLASEVSFACRWPYSEIIKHVRWGLVNAAGGVNNDDEAQRLRSKKLEEEEKRIAEQLGPNFEGLKLLKQDIERSAGYKYLMSQPDFDVLLDSFARKAKSKNNAKFANPRAWFWFIGNCALSLALYEYRTTNKVHPKIASKQVKEKALNAIKELLACQKNGLQICDYSPNRKVSASDVRDMEVMLTQAIQNHTSRQNNQYATARECIEHFAYVLYTKFDAIPPVLVTNFAPLVGYQEPKGLNQLAKQLSQNLKANNPSTPPKKA